MRGYIFISVVFMATLALLGDVEHIKHKKDLQIHEFYTELFERDVVKMELTAYNEIKNQKLRIPTNYLAVPWDVLAWDGPYQKRLKTEVIEKLSTLKFDHGFTVILNLGWTGYLLLPLFEKIGIDCVFTPCTTYKEDRYNNIKIIGFPYYAMHGVDPSPIKDILYSFIGSTPKGLAHPIREEILNMTHPENTIVKRRGTFMYLPGVEEYKDTLARSRYCLCPPGNLPIPGNPEFKNEPGIMRFYEALRAGAIPVFVNDSWKLPDGFDWDRCIVRVRESDVHNIPAIVASIPPEIEQAKRQACFEAYQMFSGENFISAIKRHYGLLERKHRNKKLRLKKNSL